MRTYVFWCPFLWKVSAPVVAMVEPTQQPEAEEVLPVEELQQAETFVEPEDESGQVCIECGPSEVGHAGDKLCDSDSSSPFSKYPLFSSG